ncbi:protein YgfX [Vibrio metschnikovii]|uniref:protein YgfX n=1 Tax=Vibrio metschnikovii TaxID=28172 RepID=UPI0028FC7897|nr:protein YgfX [Vibrio metschnikovii]
MSLIISAKSVKLALTPSLFAHITAWCLLMLLIWALLISPIPLVAAVVILCYWLKTPLLDWLPATLSQEVEIDFSGRLRWADQEFSYQGVSLLYRGLFIRFYGRQRSVLLWRDSCSETDYRQLLGRLKREHSGSR